MRKSKVIIALNDDQFSLEDAAILLDYDKMKLLNLVNRSPDGFKLREKDNVIIKRVDIPRAKRGIELVRVSDNKRWQSVKELSEEIRVNKSTLTNSIFRNHFFEYNGEKYIAPNYVPRKIVNRTPKSKRVEIEPLTQKPILNTIPSVKTEVKVSTEQQAFDLLKKLAIERIQNTQYEKASKVLSALEMLTN